MKSNMAKQQVAYKQLKRMEALYRNVRLPNIQSQYAGRGVEGHMRKL
jgi:hypothetical protein